MAAREAAVARVETQSTKSLVPQQEGREEGQPRKALPSRCPWMGPAKAKQAMFWRRFGGDQQATI